jgi:hypothetical protein
LGDVDEGLYTFGKKLFNNNLSINKRKEIKKKDFNPSKSLVYFNGGSVVKVVISAKEKGLILSTAILGPYRG